MAKNGSGANIFKAPETAAAKRMHAAGRRTTHKGTLKASAGGVGVATAVSVAATGGLPGIALGGAMFGGAAKLAKDGAAEITKGRDQMSKAKAIDRLVQRSKGTDLAGRAGMRKAAPAQVSGKDRTEAFTDSLGRHYKNGRAIPKK